MKFANLKSLKLGRFDDKNKNRRCIKTDLAEGNQIRKRARTFE